MGSNLHVAHPALCVQPCIFMYLLFWVEGGGALHCLSSIICNIISHACLWHTVSHQVDGSLRFSIYYDQLQSLLVVVVLQAEGLLNHGQKHNLQPFVKISLMWASSKRVEVEGCTDEVKVILSFLLSQKSYWQTSDKIMSGAIYSYLFIFILGYYHPYRLKEQQLSCGQCFRNGRLALWKAAATLCLETSSAAFCGSMRSFVT